MAYTQAVSPETFQAIHNVNIDKLSSLTEQQLRPILPCLVRMSLCAPLDTSEMWTLERKKILRCLSGIDVVNSLVALLSIDFHELEQDARKEMNVRNKLGGIQTESTLISQLEHGLALDFERSDAARKLRLLLSELLFIMSQMKETRTEFYHKSSELFESDVYLEEVSDVLCIAQAELPSLLPVKEVAEALLHVDNGPWLLCRMVANVPDSFFHVCTSLISNGEQQDEQTLGGQRRSEALRMLCEMCPAQALTIRAICVKHCRLPSLAVALTLHHCHESSDSSESEKDEGLSDVVAFVIGLLLGGDQDVRNWFAQFIRNGQRSKDSSSILHALRQELQEQVICILPVVSDGEVVQGCAFIRLYCALKCIAGLRFNDEEIGVLLRLITCRPKPSGAGVRFISLGLCLLLTCPYLLGNSDQEKTGVEWIKWMVQESGHFEQVSGMKASFGEMLLLIAIHYHSGQNGAIADLVSSTLGIKSAVKANTLSKMKNMFIQEIFTEQIVAAHAVKVPVTQGLNAHISGYLPVHCIYQLLKTRAFSKHKVNIKGWIFHQFCSSTTPIHPIVPPLIEVFVNSIIIPSSKTDRLNEPITEEEILYVFKDSLLTKHLGNYGDSMDVSMDTNHSDDVEKAKSKFTAQLLVLYYVLLYQDTVLTNMKTIVTANRKVARYSDQLLSQLPIKALVRAAQKEQVLYAGLFAPLLKLLATYFPHLCLVEDWLDEERNDLIGAHTTLSTSSLPCTIHSVQQAFTKLPEQTPELLLYLEQLSALSSVNLLPYTELIMDNLARLLQPGLPRRLLEVVKTIWIKLHTVIPRKIRVMTVNSLRSHKSLSFKIKSYTEKDLTIDPIIVLRADDRVFRCPPLTEILLRVLEAFLQASRCYLSQDIQSNPVLDKSGQIQPTAEKEELKNALIVAQESAAVQILLEACMPNDDDQKHGSLLSNLREVQCLVCSRLHQMYIADPNLVKLVHFQGYPSELLPVTVAGIPSMHICLDFIPELLSQPHLHKQMFAIELVSHLSLQYSLPKSMGVAKLTVNVMNTLLGVLSSESLPDFYQPTLPGVVRISRAFPPLCDDIVAFLLQLGRMVTSKLSTFTNHTALNLRDEASIVSTKLSEKGKPLQKSLEKEMTTLEKYTQLNTTIQTTFGQLVRSTAMLRHQVH